MNITIIGSNGQLGTDLTKTLQTKHNVTALKHQDIEVTDYASCQILKQHNPNIIINTAAFHKTDQCEEEPLKTFQINTLGARNITKISTETGATPIYISTDYVFDGTKTKPYTETRPAKPHKHLRNKQTRRRTLHKTNTLHTTSSESQASSAQPEPAAKAETS